jgi:hypothetical protein
VEINLDDDQRRYDPSPKQVIFHRSPHREKLYGGAVGGGKTRALCEEANNLSLEFPGNRGYMCRRDGTDFKKTVLDPVLLREVIDPRLIRDHNKSEQKIVYVNGSEIYYGGAEKAEDAWTLGWFAVDQAEQLDKTTYDNLLARLRLLVKGHDNMYRCAILNANPAPGWVKDRFIPPGGTVDVYDHRPESNRIYIPARPSENPGVPSDYESQLRADHDEMWVRRYVEGDWASFAGRVYQLRGEQILPRDELYRKGERVWISVDFGYRRAAVLWLQVRGETVYIIDELNTQNQTTPELAGRVRQLTHEKGYRVVSGTCDPAGASKNMQTGIPDISVFRTEAGVPLTFTTQKHLRDISSGVRRLQSRIRTADGRTRLYVARECQHLLNCIENYCYPSEKDNQALKEEPIKDGVHDHALDALRYFEVGHFAASGGKGARIGYG